MEDFDRLPGKPVDAGEGNGTRWKVLPDGNKAIVRPNSSEKKPTLEFQNQKGQPIHKYRYGRP